MSENLNLLLILGFISSACVWHISVTVGSGQLHGQASQVLVSQLRRHRCNEAAVAGNPLLCQLNYSLPTLLLA